MQTVFFRAALIGSLACGARAPRVSAERFVYVSCPRALALTRQGRRIYDTVARRMHSPVQFPCHVGHAPHATSVCGMRSMPYSTEAHAMTPKVPTALLRAEAAALKKARHKTRA